MKSNSGALVPTIGPGGEIQWQAWTYADLLDHLNKDLTLESTTYDLPSGLAALGLLQPARGHRSGALTLSGGTRIPIDAIDFDLTNGALSTSTGGYTVPATGYYLVTTQVQLGAVIGELQTYAFDATTSAPIMLGTDSDAAGAVTAGIVPLTANHRIDLYGWTSTPTALSVNVDGRNSMSITRVA